MNLLLGSFSVGKTTLLKRIKELRPDIYTTDGFSRPVKLIKQKVGLTDVQEQIAINELTIWAFENYQGSNVITGRSPIDAIIYSNLLYPEIATDELEKYFIEKLKNVKNVFYIPIEFEIEDDGVRMIDKEFQRAVDEASKAFCIKHNINCIQLTGSVEERVQEIMKYL